MREVFLSNTTSQMEKLREVTDWPELLVAGA